MGIIPNIFLFHASSQSARIRIDLTIGKLFDFTWLKNTHHLRNILGALCDAMCGHKHLLLDTHKFSHGKDYQPTGKYFFQSPNCSKIGGEYAMFTDRMKECHDMTIQNSNFDSAMLITKLSVEVEMEPPEPVSRCKDRKKNKESSESESPEGSATFDSWESEDSE